MSRISQYHKMIPPALKSELVKLKSEDKPTDVIRQELIHSGWPPNLVSQVLASEDISQVKESVNVPVVQSIPQNSNIGNQNLPQEHIIQNKVDIGESIDDNNKILKYIDKVVSGKKKFRVFLAGLALGVIFCLKPSYSLIKYGIPYIDNFDQKANAVIDEVFPTKLEIKIKRGVASTNVTEPYFLTISQGTLENLFNFTNTQNGKEPQSKIRILTLNTNGTVEDFDKFQTLAMLTSKNLVYYSDSDVKIQSLSQVPDMTIDKTLLKNKLDEYENHGKLAQTIKAFIFLSPILFILFYSIGFLLKVLGLTFLVWIINKILQTNKRFSRLYGLVGTIYFIPAFILIILNYIPYVKIFYSWFSTTFSVLTLSIAYVFLKRISETNSPT